MGLAAIDLDKTWDYIEDKLNENWIWLGGDYKLFNLIEIAIYTPGTKENNHFELVFMPRQRRGFYIFALCKKTEKLRKLLQLDDHEFTLLKGGEIYQFAEQIAFHGLFQNDTSKNTIDHLKNACNSE